MRDTLNAIFVLSYFPCSDFPGLLVCDGGDFGEMHTIKVKLMLPAYVCCSVTSKKIQFNTSKDFSNDL